MLLLSLLSPLLAALVPGAAAETAPELDIAQGRLRGSIGSSYAGLPYYSFQGIPYAKPPTGQLRFKVSSQRADCEFVDIKS